jgi:hypothetical protein
VHPYCHYGTALLQRLDVIGIILILIYILYLKKAVCKLKPLPDSLFPLPTQTFVDGQVMEIYSIHMSRTNIKGR